MDTVMTAAEVTMRQEEAMLLHHLYTRGFYLKIEPLTETDKKLRRTPRMTMVYLDFS